MESKKNVMYKEMMRSFVFDDPQDDHCRDDEEEEKSDEVPRKQQQPLLEIMITPKFNEICNDYLLQPQESDIEHEGNVFHKEEEIYRGSFGTTYMFKGEDANFGLTRIAVKAGIPHEE